MIRVHPGAPRRLPNVGGRFGGVLPAAIWRERQTSEGSKARGHRPARRVAAGLGALGALWATLAVPAQASATPTPDGAGSVAVAIAASVNGHAVAGSSAGHPVELSADVPATLRLRITNFTSRAVTVDTVQLAGRAAGLTFFEYDTSVDLPVPARSATSLGFTLDLGGLGGQATGLFPGAVRLLGDHRKVLASEAMVADVRGSLLSVYGFFGIALAVLTALALLAALLALARHRLSPNRWLRATRMLTPGIGLGLVSVFTLSATRVMVPTNGSGLVSVAVFAAVFFVLGYLTPTPETPGDEDGADAGAGEGLEAGDGAEGGVEAGLPAAGPLPATPPGRAGGG